MHTYIANREATLLSPLHPTEPIHIRLFFSKERISKENYQKYLACMGCENQCTEFHAFGHVPPSVSKRSLMPPNAKSTHVDKINYDFVLEALDDYHAYLDFVKQTLLIEEKRPVFCPKTNTNRHEDLKEKLEFNDISLQFTITKNCKHVKDRNEINTDNNENPIFLLTHPPSPTKSNATYLLWNTIRDKFKKYAEFYRIEDESIIEPEITFPWSKTLWKMCYNIEDIEDHINSKKISLHQLSTGHLILDTERHFWEKVLGTEAMPNVRIQMSLSLQGVYLLKKGRDEELLELKLNSPQLMIINHFFKDPNLQPFSLSAVYDLFDKSDPVSITPTENYKCVNLFTYAVHTLAEKHHNQLVGKDTYECVWETVKAMPDKTPDANQIKEELSDLLHKFKTSQDPLQNPPLMSLSPTLFQYGFLLYMLNKKQINRTKVEYDYQSLIDYYLQTKMDLQGLEFTPAHLTILYPLLAPNTEFLEKAEPTNELSILEARILLSIFQYPIEYRNPEQQIALFQIVVNKFAKKLKKDEEGRVGAKALWEAFLAFLRKHKIDYVGFFGTQQEFNDIIRDLGWEQKRMAQGKVWLKMGL